MPEKKSIIRAFLLKFFMNRSIVIKKEGKIFILIAIGVGVAALNSGNNLLYLLLALLLSIIIVSGILSEQSVKGITVTRSAPNYSYKNKNSLFSYTISNKKKFISSYLIRVVDVFSFKELESNIFFIKIPPKFNKHLSYNITFSTRGVVKFEGTKISTSFPFGLIIKNRLIKLQSEHIVYPEIRDISKLILAGESGIGDKQSGKKGDGFDTYGLREFVDGDRTKFIHWKSYAKYRKLMVKEFEDESQKEIEIHLLLKNTDSTLCEEAITLSASFYHHFYYKEFNPHFYFNGNLISKTKRDYHALMRYLALIDLNEKFRECGIPAYRKDIVQIVVSDYLNSSNPSSKLLIFGPEKLQEKLL